MIRNAFVIGETSSNRKAKPSGDTRPSLSAAFSGDVRVTVLSSMVIPLGYAGRRERDGRRSRADRAADDGATRVPDAGDPRGRRAAEDGGGRDLWHRREDVRAAGDR